MLFDEMNEEEAHLLKLTSDNESGKPSSFVRWRMPFWEDIELAINEAYQYGGFAWLEVLSPEDAYIKKISIDFEVGKCRILAITRDEDPKNELLEWWNPQAGEFTGITLIRDDETDTRMVCTDLAVIKQYPRALFEQGKLTEELFSHFRTQWNPMPR
ncbi:hypothetical protein LIN78_05155 [Leeia sp. TBRC 13508]|uniref:Uncharacterized protein n=1 Tax=Leeia speluncae TaxID=2884804 RepID=A0ABS8D404_9NEIS|nr:hypothetical protein [Leeia speluncae]MCB6182934.1 hypothetical protein [Leeia speluncae]